MLQIGDTAVDDDTEVKGWTMALQEFHGANHAPAKETIEVADKAKESNGPSKGMDANDNKVLFCKD